MKTLLDPINLRLTALPAIALIALAVLANPQAQAAIVALFSHPTLAGGLSAAGILAGVILLYIAKPPLTSDAPPKGP